MKKLCVLFFLSAFYSLLPAALHAQSITLSTPIQYLQFNPNLPLLVLQPSSNQVADTQDWLGGAIKTQSLGTGDGVTKTFTGTLSPLAVSRGSFTIVAGAVTITEVGTGVLLGPGSTVGTINYTTGAVSVTFSTAPASGVAITASWLQVVTWIDSSGNIHGNVGGTPGGSSGQLQYNNAGVFGGTSGWSTNGTTTLTGAASSLLDMSAAAQLKVPALLTGTFTVSSAAPALTLTGSPVFAQFTGSGNNTGEFDIQNISNAALASTDFVVNSDNATASTNYGDFGINSSGNTDAAYTAFAAGDVYLYAQTQNLDFSTASAKNINFFAGGTLTANQVGSFSGTTLGLLSLGKDNVNAGQLQLANGSAAFHNILGSAATANNTVLFFSTAPVTGDLVDCVTASTTCTLTDAGILAANVNTSSAALSSNAIVTGNGSRGIQTPSSGSTLDSSGNLTLATGGSFTLSAGSAASVAATITGTSNAGNQDILELNLSGGSGGNGFKVDHSGNVTGAATITATTSVIVGSGTAATPGTGTTLDLQTLGTGPSGTLTNHSVIYGNGSNVCAQVVNNAVDWGCLAGWNVVNLFAPTLRTSGANPYFQLSIPADTAITAATEGPGFRTVTATRTWASTGTVALQRENFFAGPTYASASASQTFTDAFTLYATPPIAGSNAIFTRGHTLGIVDSTSAASAITGAVVVCTTIGTAAGCTGIGGGNINTGGTITGTAGATTGAGTAINSFTDTASNTGTGAILSLTTAAGSAAGTAASTGLLVITPGTPTASNSSVAGAQGAVINGGIGAATSSGTSTGGAGGADTLIGGVGGASLTTGTGGAGGAIIATGGVGGSSGSGGVGGKGGNTTITGGSGGTDSTGAATGGAGGDASISGGVGGGTITGGAGGAASLVAGAGANGSTAGGAGGNVSITAGNAGTGGTPAGGKITLTPGVPTSTGVTGEVLIAGAAAAAHLSATQTTKPSAGGTCTTPAVANNSTDMAGQVSSASCTASQTITATFNKTWTTAPWCVVSPANAAGAGTASGAAIFFASASATILTVTTQAAASTAPAYNYVCVGVQ